MNKRWLLFIIIGALALVAGALVSVSIRQLVTQPNTIERVIMAKIVSAEPGYLTVDELTWFNGQAAVLAMREDGVCPLEEDCYPPNNYYIRNASPDIIRYRVAPQVEVLMQTWSHNEDGNYYWNQSVPYVDLVNRLDLYSKIPFHITLKENSVIKIVEQYIP